MARIGYHISHEQFSPRELLRLAVKAEQAGFDFCLSSDHFAPWSRSQGQSGFAWSWLGSALAMTKKIDLGVVNCPVYRYHPAIIAQASATLDQMFPGRFWLTVGSGQALNEAITGAYWPSKDERNSKLKAAVEIIRGLWNGETITTEGPIRVTDARLYTLPETEMKITGAAISAETARWMAPWADSLITISQPKEKLEKVLDAWRNYGGDQKPVKIKVQVSYDKTHKDALNDAWDQWRTNVFASSVQSELRNPLQFENAAEHVKPDEVSKMVFVSENTNQHIEWLSSIAEMGFAEIDLHNVNRSQERFLDDFGTKVIPELVKITNTVGR